MAIRRSCLVLAAALAGFSFQPRARACGVSPPAYWTLLGASLGPDDLVPTDGVFLIAGKAWTDVYPDRSPGELASGTTVIVHDAGGALVPGVVQGWYGGSAPLLAWKANTLLAANAVYTLDAAIMGNPKRPPGAAGETTLHATFHVGPGPAAPLRLTGELGVSLDTYDRLLWKECNGCGTGCKPAGTLRTLRALVTIPAVTGGQVAESYGALLWLTSDRPHEFPNTSDGTNADLSG